MSNDDFAGVLASSHNYSLLRDQLCELSCAPKAKIKRRLSEMEARAILLSGSARITSGDRKLKLSSLRVRLDQS